MSSRYFVGVGIDKYELDEFEDLTAAFSDVQQIAALLRETHHIALSSPAAHTELEPSFDAAEKLQPESLVLLWSGHGHNSGGLRLVLPGRKHGESASEVMYRAMHSRARQVLMIFDVCQAGAALEAQSLVDTLFEQLHFDSAPVWCGLLMSCSVNDLGARDGRFGELITKLLREGPDDPDLAFRWTQYNQMIRGDDLADAVIKEWTDTDQAPRLRVSGNAQPMLPNPLFRPGAPHQVVEHLLRATRSGDQSEARSWFTGRTAEVNRIVSWVTSGTPGIRLVIGSAGTGKSATLGRVISAAQPTEREFLLEQSEQLGHDDPGVGSIAAQLLARALTVEEVAGDLDNQLVGSGVLQPIGPIRGADGIGRRNASQLVGDLQAAAHVTAKPPVIVLDGLDEARDQAFAVIDDLLVRLAPFCTVIVSSRPLTHPGGGPLHQILNPLDTLNFDEPESRRTGQQAIGEYVRSRLAGVSDIMDPDAIAEILRSEEDSPFILARIITDQLCANPIDTSAPDWQLILAGTVGEALETDLADIAEPPTPQGWSAAQLGRSMLLALTWAMGSGFPEEEWLTSASALTGLDLDRDHSSWALNELGRYIDQAGEHGVAVHRLAHRSIADHLRNSEFAIASRRETDQLGDTGDFDPALASTNLVTTALIRRYRLLIESGIPADESDYLWHWASDHAAQAGAPGVEQFASLASIEQLLVPALAVSYLIVSEQLTADGDLQSATHLTEEVVKIYRVLSTEEPLYRNGLAGALTNLGVLLGELGQHQLAIGPAEEAVQIMTELAESDLAAQQANLAGTLNNLAICYGKVGRKREAVTTGEDSVEQWLAVTEHNPAYLPELAGALTNLGNHYARTGRHADAFDATKKSVTIYLQIADEKPHHMVALGNALNSFSARHRTLGHHHESLAFAEQSLRFLRQHAGQLVAHRIDLADSLHGLSISYNDVGRSAEAIDVARESVNIYRSLGQPPSGPRPGLASALLTLGIALTRIGAHDESLEATAESVRLYRKIAEHHRQHQAELANALNGLSVSYGNLGLFEESLACGREAIDIYRTLAAGEPDFVWELAGNLVNLGNHLGDLGRHGEAIAPAEEAVQTLSDLVPDFPAHRDDLALALSNLGVRYGRVGRPSDAIEPTLRAIELRRELVAENLAYRSDLAASLANLGGYLSEAGRACEAIAPSEEAVVIGREMVVTNDEFETQLASALASLGSSYQQVGRDQEAIIATTEAVTRLRRITAADPVLLPELANALNNLGNHLHSVGQLDEAIEHGNEAVGLSLALATELPAAHLPRLSMALTNLDHHYREAHSPELGDRAWQSAIAALTGGRNFDLLLHRVGWATAGDPRTAEWLYEVRTHGRDESQNAARELARLHYQENPEQWSAAWQAISGQALPTWLTIDSEQLTLVGAWLNTLSFEAEYLFMVEHPELADSRFDSAVDEVLQSMAADEVARIRRLRSTAHTAGIEAAYRPLMRDELARRFARSTTAEQVNLLRSHSDELFSTEVTDALNNHHDPDALVAFSFLQLAQALPSDRFARIVSARDRPEEFEQLLFAEAPRLDSQLLFSMADLALDSARTPSQTAHATTYLAIAEACLIDEDPSQGNQLDPAASLRTVLSIDPQLAGAVINELARLAATRPACLALIPIVTSLSQELKHVERSRRRATRNPG